MDCEGRTFKMPDQPFQNCHARTILMVRSDLQAIGVSADEWYEVVQYR